MSRKANVVVIGRQEFVDIEDHLYGLGLKLPEVKTQSVPTMAVFQPLLSMNEIKAVVEDPAFFSGDKLFDSSWITNQNGFGSCACYAGSSALAKARVLSGQDRQDLSGDYLYSLVNGGRDNGSMLDDVMHTMLQKGVCLAKTVPLGGIYRSKYNTAVADREALRFRGHELYAVPDEQSLATALALRFPVVIAIHVTNKWRQFDADDILAPASGPGNHCEHLDGIKWSNKRGCFLYRKATSHGTAYSDDGYCWTTWEDHYKTTSRYHQFYAVPGAIQDPQADNPSGTEINEDDRPLAKPVLVVKSRPGCVWCDRWKATELKKCEDAGIDVQSGDFQSSGVPAFNLRVGEQEYRRDGFWPYLDIAKKIGEMR